MRLIGHSLGRMPQRGVTVFLFPIEPLARFPCRCRAGKCLALAAAAAGGGQRGRRACMSGDTADGMADEMGGRHSPASGRDQWTA